MQMSILQLKDNMELLHFSAWSLHTKYTIQLTLYIVFLIKMCFYKQIWSLTLSSIFCCVPGFQCATKINSATTNSSEKPESPWRNSNPTRPRTSTIVWKSSFLWVLLFFLRFIVWKSDSDLLIISVREWWRNWRKSECYIKIFRYQITLIRISILIPIQLWLEKHPHVHQPSETNMTGKRKQWGEAAGYSIQEEIHSDSEMMICCFYSEVKSTMIHILEQAVQDGDCTWPYERLVRSCKAQIS